MKETILLEPEYGKCKYGFALVLTSLVKLNNYALPRIQSYGPCIYRDFTIKLRRESPRNHLPLDSRFY